MKIPHDLKRRMILCTRTVWLGVAKQRIYRSGWGRKDLKRNQEELGKYLLSKENP